METGLESSEIKKNVVETELANGGEQLGLHFFGYKITDDLREKYIIH